jgi:Lrp/AsnC family transcriptional regulator for asnA, asnC and gidA
MDETDKKILEVLQRNSRTPYRDIARHAKISDVAVHKRIKKLSRIIKAFTVLVDQREYGRKITAIVAMTCDAGRTPEIARALGDLEDVTEVYTTLGEHDIVAKIRTKDLDSLKKLVERDMIKIGGINEIRTSIVFDCIKENVNLVM